MASRGNKKTGRGKAAAGENRIRVRGKRLDKVDQTKLTLAYWMLAKRLVEDRTDPRLPTEAEVIDEASKDEPHPEAAT